jgi:hypothetical protein
MSLMTVLIVVAVIALIAWGVTKAQTEKASCETSNLPEVQAQRVKVVDIDMPFGSMVTFMVKWSLASIPALMILALFGFAVAMVFGAAVGTGR